MPVPSDVLEAFVAAESEAHEQALDALTYQIAATWVVEGGIDDTSQARWVAAVVPLLAAARLAFARRGAAWARLMWALQTDGDILAGGTDRFDDHPDWGPLATRAERHAASPVVAARWLVNGANAPTHFAELGPTTRRAIADVQANAATFGGPRPGSLLEALAADPEPGPFATAVERATARATSLAVGDANRAHAIGIEAGVPPAGQVKRYLKVPRPTACGWCFTVATRGYRTAQTVPRHDHDKCLVLPLFTKTTAGVPGRGDWQQRLTDAGYGPLLTAYRATDAASRARLAQQVIDAVPGLADLFAAAAPTPVGVP